MVGALKAAMFCSFCILLAYASVEDGRYKKVRRFIWYLAGMAGIGLCFLNFFEAAGSKGLLCDGRKAYDWQIAVDLLLFCLLQLCLFSKMYGMADCFAFICCGIVWTAFGGGMMTYLIQMLVAIAFLGIIQIFRRNVGKDGNLKKPVAFVPYIMASFFACLISRGILTKWKLFS